MESRNTKQVTMAKVNSCCFAKPIGMWWFAITPMHASPGTKACPDKWEVSSKQKILLITPAHASARAKKWCTDLGAKGCSISSSPELGLPQVSVSKQLPTVMAAGCSFSVAKLDGLQAVMLTIVTPRMPMPSLGPKRQRNQSHNCLPFGMWPSGGTFYVSCRIKKDLACCGPFGCASLWIVALQGEKLN